MRVTRQEQPLGASAKAGRWQATAAQTRRLRLPVWKRLLFIIVADFLVLGMLAIIGELACRVLAPQMNYGMLPGWTMESLQFSDDMYIGWELRPGVLDHNSAGFRGHEVAVKKPRDVWRILMIGDSVTYGLGVAAHEAYPSVLESKLNDAGLGPVEVLNFGVPAHNAFQAYTLLKTRGFQYDPDLVVMAFTADDIETSPVILNVGGEMCLFRNQFEGFDVVNNSLHWAVFQRSHFYRLLYKHAALAIADPGADFGAVYVRPEVQWETVLQVAKLSCQHQTPFLLLLSPWLLPYETPEDLKSMQRFAESFEQIRAYARKSGLDVVDLGPLYQEYAGELKLNRDDQIHPNPLGHALIAERLADRVRAIREKSISAAVAPRH